MSFDINPPSRNFSNVQASQGSCPGGGGNTGYFQRGKKEENDLKLSKDYPEDSFEKINELFNTEEEIGLFDSIKALFKKLFNKIKAVFVKTKPAN